MFVLVIEKRISAKAGKEDWYTLVAQALSFEPRVGLEIQLKKHMFIKLERVVYDPNHGTFWAQVEPMLHPKPNAAKLAEAYAAGDWDRAVEEKDLEVAKEVLRDEAVRKLQSMILRARPGAIRKTMTQHPFG